MDEKGFKKNILFIEDLPSDYELAVRALSREGLNFVSKLVETEKEMVDALRDFKPDIVISDYSMPRFNGMRALKVLQEYDSNMPFIVLTGSINEETAADCIKAGASDYVIKERMTRLPHAVREALNKAEAVKALRNSQIVYRQLLEGMLDGFVYIDMEGVVLDTNESYSKMLGYTKSELLGMNYLDYTPEEWYDYEKGVIYNKIFASGYSVVYEKEYRRKDGTLFPVELRTFLVKGEDGQNRGMWAIVRDITEQKETDKRIRMLSKAIEQSPVSIAITDSEGYIEFVNTAFTRFRQYTYADVKGRKPRIFNPGHLDSGTYNCMHTALEAGDIWEGEFKNRKKDKTEFWEYVTISPLLEDNGVISNYILIMEDITEKKKIYRDLVVAKNRAEESDKLKTAFLHNI